MNLVIIEDNSIFRNALTGRLTAVIKDMCFVGEAESVESGNRLLSTIETDIALIDLELKDGTGIDVVLALDSFQFDIIFMSTHDDRDFRVRDIKVAGFRFYNKGSDTAELIGFIKTCEYGQHTQASINALKDHYEALDNDRQARNTTAKPKPKSWFSFFRNK